MRIYLSLLVLLFGVFAFPESSGTFNFITLFPSSLPATCRQGDLRDNTADGNVYVCGSANNWTTSGSVPPAIGAYTVMSNNTSSTAVASGNNTMILGTPAFSATDAECQATQSNNAVEHWILQNTNTGTSAGAEYDALNNNGTASTGFGAFGINGSNYAGTGSLNLSSATYLYSSGGDLSLGTSGSSAIHFVVNSGTTDAFRISSSGGLTCPAFSTAGIVANNSSGLLSSTNRPTLVGTDFTEQGSAPSNPASGALTLYANTSGGMDTVNSSGTVTALLSGTVTPSEGGTGLTSITAYNLLVGNGTSNAGLIAPAAGTVLAASSASANPTFSATPTLGVNTSTTGQLALANGGAGGATVTVQNNGATSAYNFNLPTTAGSSGDVLTSAGGGSSAMTWSSPLTNPMTTEGDIIYENATPAAARLAVGTTGQVLTVSGGLPAWGNPASSSSGINILGNYNYNAELGATTDWTNSGGTFNVTSTAADVANGTYSFGFLASASSQTVTSNLTTIPAGLYGQNCLLEFYYKGFDSNMTAEVTDGTNVIASQVLTAESGYTVQDMNFICPSSGSLEMELVSTGSSAQGYFDEVHLGSATNLAQISQAALVGQVKITACAAAWSTTSTSMAAFSAESSCTYTVLNGTGVSAPSTNIPGITFSSLPPGIYVLKYEGLAEALYSSSSTTVNFQFWDGTTTASELSYVGNPGTSGAQVAFGIPGFQQTISYSSAQSNITFQVRASTGNAGTSADLFGTTAAPGVISVYRFPTSSQQSWNPSTAPANWAATSSLSATTTSTSQAVITGSLSGSITTSGTPRNITCTADGTDLGIDCTLPRIGNYLVCYTGRMSNSGTNENHPFLTDGSGSVIVGDQSSYNGTATGHNGFGSCGGYTASSTAVKFFVEAFVGGGTGTFTPTSFSVTGLDQSLQAPYTVGSVTSTTTGKVHVEALSFTCSSAASISAQSPGGAWTIGNISSSGCAFTIPSSEFKATPYSCTPVVTGSSAQSTVLTAELTSATSVTVFGSGSPTSFSGTMLCMGPD